MFHGFVDESRHTYWAGFPHDFGHLQKQRIRERNDAESFCLSQNSHVNLNWKCRTGLTTEDGDVQSPWPASSEDVWRVVCPLHVCNSHGVRTLPVGSRMQQTANKCTAYSSFPDTLQRQKNHKEHAEEILNVRGLEYSSTSWTRSLLVNDQAIKWATAKAWVYADSVLCIGRMEHGPGVSTLSVLQEIHQERGDALINFPSLSGQLRDTIGRCHLRSLARCSRLWSFVCGFG